MKIKSVLLSFIVIALIGCESENSSGSTPVLTNVNVYTSVDNCSVAVDVPNCHFDNGIYVLKIDSAVTAAQQERVRVQIVDFMKKASDDVRKLFNQKRVIIGLLEDDPGPSSDSVADAFVLKLADSMNEKNSTPKVLDAIELVYTNLDEKDETLKLTTYQKLIQLFDYYVDGNNNSSAGTELQAAFDAFKLLLSTQASVAPSEYLIHNPCNYGNGQLVGHPCLTDPNYDSDGDPDGKGNRDTTHILSADLNPGAMMGITYEYMRDPSKVEIGEVKGSNGTAFSNTGTIGTGNSDAIDWSNPAFKPLADYVNKWFLVN